MDSHATDRALERRVSRKVAWRLIPFLGLLYFFSFLDRVNVGFAALTMNVDLGISAAAFGFGSGIFFIGYVLFEVPSNVLLERFGARVWIARIMITWGILSTCMMFAQGPISFAVLRFLLGVAEAGFFPGIIYYLTCWFPSQQRARIIALFLIALPLSSVIGAPLSTMLLGIDAWGLHGWQWMFLLEGTPTILLGVVVLRWLTDRPADATWLTDQERAALARSLQTPPAAVGAAHTQGLRAALSMPWVWLAGLIYFSILVGLYGFGFWMPQIIGSMGELTNIEIGLVTMIPYTFACLGMVLWGRHSDATGERKWHVALPPALAAIALAASGGSENVMVGFVALVVAAIGIYAALPAFWALVSRGLNGIVAAGVIALVNSLGNLGGFVGPMAIGYVRQTTGSYMGSLLFIAGLLLLSTILTLVVFRRERTLKPVSA
jgi:MFS transporter, ACS family, tartrate transporter